MNHNSVDVSVIIPAYNAADTIRDALTSALNQTLTNIEVLVVDDGSTDETSAVVDTFILNDSRVRLLRQQNFGVGAARNTGIGNARGAYIAPLDADDTWERDKLERQVSRMEEYGSECGLVYCRSNLIDANDRWLRVAPPCELEGKLRSVMIQKNLVGSASVPIFRSAALQTVGRYLERSEQNGAQGCEDWDLNIRMAEKFEVGAVDKHLVNYRQRHSSMTLRHEDMARSYATVMERTRVRNADLSNVLFRRSASSFHSYLATNCYRWTDYAGCITCAFRAMRANPRALISHQLYRLILKSIAWSAARSLRMDSVPDDRWAPLDLPRKAPHRAQGRNHSEVVPSSEQNVR